MNKRQLLNFGIVGSVIAAICCFTPALVVGLGAVGLGAWLAWSDAVVLPALFVFLAITVVAAARLRRAAPSAETEESEE